MRSAGAIATNASAAGFDALAHTCQPVAVAGRTADAVIDDLQPIGIGIVAQQHAHVLRARMAYDVGHRLAQGQREHRFGDGFHPHAGDVGLDGDTRVLEKRPRAFDLGCDAGVPIAGHRSPKLAQRFARDAFDFVDLRCRTYRIAIGEFRSELALDRDQRERMAENVVQVARDSLAFGDFLSRAQQFLMRAAVLGPSGGREADGK